MAALAGTGGVRAWWLAARPRTFAVGAAPVLVGTALAALEARARVLPAMAALAVALLLQLAANLANDAFDHERGADGPERLGPPRAAQLGWLTPRALKGATAAVLALASVPGLYLVSLGGWPLLLVGALCLLAAVLYTGGPWPLGYHGLGDVAVFIFFGGVAVAGSYFVQAGTPTPAVWLAAAAVGALATAVLVVNNLRDLESDRRVGKRTLAVRLGRRATQIEYGLLLLLPFALLPVFAILVAPTLALPVLMVPRAAALYGRVAGAYSAAQLNLDLATTAQLTAQWAALFAVGALLALLALPLEQAG